MTGSKLRVLVTGGSGVIGLELVPKLVLAGHLVTVADIKPKPAIFENVQYVCGDLNNLTLSELSAIDPHVIIHLAATFERSEESFEFYRDYFDNNVKLSHNLMGLARTLKGLKRVVFASSYLVYDPNLYMNSQSALAPTKLSEYSPLAPRNLIGSAKLAHENELAYLKRFPETNFKIAVARIFRGYGLGSRDVISRWVRSALRGETIEVFGEAAKFDYIYSKDSAEGIYRLAMLSDFEGTLNLGTGVSRSVADVLNIIRSHIPELDAVHVNSFESIESSEADVHKLSESLNWLPEYDIDRAIPEIIKYESERLEIG